MYYLDTCTVISILRGELPGFKEKGKTIPPSDIKIPSMVAAELIAGAYNSPNTKFNLDLVNGFISTFEIVPFDEYACLTYGKLWADLKKNGKMIKSNDLIIAATVISHGGVLVTNNTRDFDRIIGLRIEDWLDQDTV